MGIKGIQPEHIENLKENNQTPTSGATCPSKQSRWILWGDLPIEYNDVKTLAILDNGAEIAIATKHIQEKWG